MKWICDRCGTILDEDELPIITHSEECGFREELIDNCSCGGHFVEANICENCGDYCVGELCDDCLDYVSTFENAKEIGEEGESDVAINDFVLSVIPKNEINDILLDYIKQMPNCNELVDKYIKSLDADYVANFMERRCK